MNIVAFKCGRKLCKTMVKCVLLAAEILISELVDNEERIK